MSYGGGRARQCLSNSKVSEAVSPSSLSSGIVTYGIDPKMAPRRLSRRHLGGREAPITVLGPTEPWRFLMASQRAVFLDKDGTVIENVPYNVDPGLIQLSPGAASGLRRLHDAGYLLFVVSNQSGVARGYFSEEALRDVEARLREMLAEFGVPLAGFAYCPHHPEGSVEGVSVACDCRKPAPGMIIGLAIEHGVAPADSWMVGDILDDVEAGRAAGCRTVLIDNGNETKWVMTPGRVPHHRVADLAEAASAIIKSDKDVGAARGSFSSAWRDPPA